MMLGARETVLVSHYSDVLSAMYAISNGEEQLSDEDAKTAVRKAMRGLFELIDKDTRSSIPDKLYYFPCTGYKLHYSQDTVYVDKESLRSRLGDNFEVPLLVDLKDCDITDEAMARKVFEKLGPRAPKSLSKITKERLDTDAGEEAVTELVIKLRSRLQSVGFQAGLKRIARDCIADSDTVAMQQLSDDSVFEALDRIKIVGWESVVTYLEILSSGGGVGTRITKSEKKLDYFCENITRSNISIHVSRDIVPNCDFYTTVAEIISTVAVANLASRISDIARILDCSEDDIQPILDRQSTYVNMTSHCATTDPPPLGSPVPLDFHHGEADRWMKQATHDLESAANCLGAGVATEWVCYIFCQVSFIVVPTDKLQQTLLIC